MKLSSIAWRNIFRNSRRSILSGTAIAVAALVIVLMFAFLEGMMQDMRANVVNYITGEIRIRNPQYTENEDLNPLHLRIDDYRQVLGALDGDGEVAAAAPRIQFYTSIYENEQTYNGIGFGVDFEREKAFMDPGASLIAGRLPRPGERELLLTTGLAEEVGVGAGDRITLLGKNMYMGMAGMTFTVSGIARFPVQGFNERFMIVPLPAAQGFLKMDDSVTEILVKTRGRGNLEQAADRLAARLALDGFAAAPGANAGSGGPDLEAKPWMAVGSWYSLMQISDLSYNLMALFFFLLGTTVIINTTMMVIYERMREIGTVSALGMTGPEIVKLFFLEAFFIGLIASLAGAVLGVALTIPLSVNGIDVGTLFEGIDFEVSSVLYPRLNLRSTLFVFVYSVVVASLASLIPSRRAAKIQPVEALRAI